ncbi:MAG: ABC transporter substrate-binding protein [Planctomycetes bacterium]|nr:ABC transporter substrate-binding protein [Planctomycetota bacterium]
MMNHRLLPVLWLALFALAGCGGKSGPPPIYVGQVATLSGPDRLSGEQAMRGIRLAVQEQAALTDKDQLRPIHVRHTDTRGKLDAFEGEAIRLVSVNRVVALLGGNTPAEVIRLDRAHVPLLSPSGLRTRDMSDLVFLTGLTPSFQGMTLARFTVNDLKATAGMVVVVDDRREDSLALAEAFVAAAQPTSRTRMLRFGKNPPAAELAKAVADAKPGVLLFAGSARDLPALLKALRPVPAVVLFGGEDGAAQVLLESPETAGVYLATAFVRDLDTPRARDFVAEFAKTNNAEPDVHAALAHDSARLLFEAIRNSKTELTPDHLKKELALLKDVPGLTGPLSFKDGTLQRPAFIVRLEKGRSTLVKKYLPDQDSKK